MECLDSAVSYLSWVLIAGGAAYLLRQTRGCARYGRYVRAQSRCCSARLGWFLQEAPAFLLPLLLLLLLPAEPGSGTGRTLLVGTFVLHYFHRSVIYAFLTKGRPMPLPIVFSASVFCSLNGLLQGHSLLHCIHFKDSWLTHVRLAAGSLVFVLGMIINIHSDHILRRLRKPGEVAYRIPRGGMFEFVSGANFFGEIVEWCGYALAVWSLPAFAFAFFTICSVGPRAYMHHRYPCTRWLCVWTRPDAQALRIKESWKDSFQKLCYSWFTLETRFLHENSCSIIKGLNISMSTFPSVQNSNIYDEEKLKA